MMDLILFHHPLHSLSKLAERFFLFDLGQRVFFKFVYHKDYQKIHWR